MRRIASDPSLVPTYSSSSTKKKPRRTVSCGSLQSLQSLQAIEFADASAATTTTATAATIETTLSSNSLYSQYVTCTQMYGFPHEIMNNTSRMKDLIACVLMPEEGKCEEYPRIERWSTASYATIEYLENRLERYNKWLASMKRKRLL